MNTLRLPLVFSATSGSLEYAIDGTTEYYATIVSNLININKGELIISQYYGCVDPTFEGDARRLIGEAVSKYVPEITVKSISSKLNATGTNLIELNFDIKDA